MRSKYRNAQEFQQCIRNCECPTCRALIRLIDKAGATIIFSPTRAGRLCEMAVVAAAGANGIGEKDVVAARRDYAHHLQIALRGPIQDHDAPIHIEHALDPSADNPIRLGQARARFEAGRYYIFWEASNEKLGERDVLEEEKRQFDKLVQRARADSAEARLSRLQNAPAIPQKFIATTTAFKRNPDVVAEVLERASGKCENPKCDKPIPFLRISDQSTYLEVHHKTPLAQGGDDTVENAIALCPNCHREAHFGSLRL
jgi:hypothetical protein